MFTPTPSNGLVFGALALGLTALGLATSSTANSRNDDVAPPAASAVIPTTPVASHGDEAAPLACDIAISKGRYGHTYEGRVTADHTTNGSYNLSFVKSGSGGSSTIRQGGNFSVSAGEIVTLGQATFNGAPADVDVSLTLHADGKTLSCGTNSDA